MGYQEMKEDFSTEHGSQLTALIQILFSVRIRDIFSGSMIRNLNLNRTQFSISKTIWMNLLQQEMKQPKTVAELEKME